MKEYKVKKLLTACRKLIRDSENDVLYSQSWQVDVSDNIDAIKEIVESEKK